jgi:precorrin-6B methylase 2
VDRKDCEKSMNLLKSNVAGFEVALHTEPAVFKPTLTTSLLTEQVLRAGVRSRSVLDLGCGAGPIAIALALAGAGHVVASDLMPLACDLTRKNAAINQVSDKIEVVQGNLFDSVSGRRFDIIVDDVSGVAEEVARLSSWFPPSVPLGGTDGSTLAIEMLTRATSYVNEGGQLFFPVLSLSNSTAITAAANRLFGGRVRSVARKGIPFNHELRANVESLLKLKDAGIIQFEQVRSRYFWTLEIFRVDI